MFLSDDTRSLFTAGASYTLVRRLAPVASDLRPLSPLEARAALGTIFCVGRDAEVASTYHALVRGLLRPTDDDYIERMRTALVKAAERGDILVLETRLAGSTYVGMGDQATAGPRVLGPESSTPKHVYTVRVVDDTGAPVSGAKVTLDVDGGPNAGTTGGDGKFTLTKSTDATAKLTLDNLDELRDKLWTQWAKPVADKPPEGDRVLLVPIGQPLGPQQAPADWLVKLVITRPPIWRVRMVGMLFDADKCFLIPQALDGVRSIVAMHEAHKAAKVLIIGHEEGDEVTGGMDMALARAKALAAYLTNKPDDWMPWFDADKSERQRWGVRELQLMLSALPGATGAPYYNGSSPGVMDDKTVAALKAFQTANGLTVDGGPGAATRKALVTKYMGLEDTSLAKDVTPVTHGCSGHSDDTLTDDGLQPDDRRMEVLFFDVDMKPEPSGETSPPGAPEYPAWKMRTVETVDFENHGIHVQIVDTKKQPVPLATVHLDGPAPQDTTADEHGFVSFWGLVAGEYMVVGTSRTGIPIPSMKLTYPTAKTILGARVLSSQSLTGQGGPAPAASGGSSSGAESSGVAPQGAS